MSDLLCVPSSLLSQDVVTSRWCMAPQSNKLTFAIDIASHRTARANTSLTQVPMALSLKVTFRKILFTCVVQIQGKS